MKSLKLLFLLVTISLLSGCFSSGKVFSDYDPNQSFSEYKSFAWSSTDPVLVSGTYPVAALTKVKMQNAIERELLALGFNKAQRADEADFLVSITLGARDKITIRRTTEYRTDPYKWRWGRGYYPYHFPETIPVTVETPYQFTEGSIALDIFDRRENRPVWHSNASKRLKTKELSGQTDKQAETAKALLEGFPPQ